MSKKYIAWVEPSEFETGESRSGSGGSFGMNTAILTSLKYSEVLGQNNDQKGIKIVFTVGEREFFNDKRVPNGEGSVLKSRIKKLFSTLSHYLVTFAGKDKAKAVLAKEYSSIELIFKAIAAAIPKSAIGKPYDIFLQYESKIRGDNKQTFLQVPWDNSQGAILSKHYPSITWELEEVKKVGGIKYFMVDEAGNEILKDGKRRYHPFMRSGWYMETDMANQKKMDSQSEDNDVFNPSEGLDDDEPSVFDDVEEATVTTDTKITEAEDDLPF